MGGSRSWLRDTIGPWLRILTVSGDRSLTTEEQTRLVTEVNGRVTLNVTLPPYRWRWQRAVAAETLEAARPPLLTLVNRTTITAMVTTEHLIARLRQATGQTREQILQDLSVSVEQQIAVAEADTEAAGGGDAGP